MLDDRRLARLRCEIAWIDPQVHLSMEDGRNRPVLLHEFIDQVYLPFQRGKWKKSTQGTSENRIVHHIVKELGDTALKDFSMTGLQAFLEEKANAGLSFSVVDHLRWDLSAIFEMGVAEKVIASNPATRLYTPKHAPRGKTRAMTVEEVNIALGSVELREQVLLHMAIFSGFPAGRNARAAAPSRVGGRQCCES